MVLVDLQDLQVVSANLAALEAQVVLGASQALVGLAAPVGPVALAALGPEVSMSAQVVWASALLAPTTSRPAR